MLEGTLSSARLGDWAWEADTDRVSFSERGARLLGVDRTRAWTRRELGERLHPDDRERVIQALEHANVAGGEYATEYRWRRDDESWVWIASRGVGVPDEAGRSRGMVGVLQDITERRRADEWRQRLAAIVESSEDAIASKSLDGIVTSWNRGAERMFGWRADEIVGRSILTIIPPERHEEERRILATLARGERVEHFETERLRKDGSRVAISLTVSPILDSSGRVVGASKIARDIGARRAVEERLREEARIRDVLVETGRAIGSDLDLERIVQKVTDATTSLTGAEFGAFFYNVSDERGNSYQLYTISGAPREAFERFGQPRATALFGPTFRGEGPIRLDDVLKDARYGALGPHHGMPPGHLPVRSYLAVAVVSPAGEVHGGLFFGHSKAGVFTQKAEDLASGIAAQAAIAIDNAQLYERVRRLADERQSLLEAERAAREDAERVNMMKDEFLATLSHELRTPLNAILGWAQVLDADPSLPEQVRAGIGVIRRNARTQAQLIADLLDMSRIISGKIRLDVQRVEPQEVVKAALEAVRHSADAKQVRLQVVLDPLAGPVWGDPNRLQQCVWNLLSNAIKFTPKGGRVSVQLARVNSHVEIAVADTGQGIEPALLPHVFERFRQGDSSTTRAHGGLGLGLSIVKHLIELHGGTARASSAGRDQGATFTLEVPVMAVDALPGSERVHPRSSAQRATTEEQPSLAGLELLVVDDEPDALQLMKRVLGDRGATVHVASSARDGLEVVRRERLDMIISDIGMPVQDGYEFLKQVRALDDADKRRTAAIALSAFARAEDRTRAHRAGYQAHVAKPVDATELVALIASIAASK